MKIFKAGFTAIIGVLAIGFTIAAEAGAFRGIKLVPPPVEGCFRRVTILCPGSSVPQLLIPDVPCQVPPPSPGKPVICVNNTVTDVVKKVYYPTHLGDCPTASIVCCYSVVPKVAPATGFTVAGFVCGNYTPVRK